MLRTMKVITSGFTLVEVLVVMLIMAISIGFISISVSSIDNQKNNLQSVQIYVEQLIDYAQLYALTHQEPMRITAHDNQLRFEIYQTSNRTWRADFKDPLLNQNKIPNTIRLIVHSKSSTNRGTTLYLLPSGEVTPYEINITEVRTGQQVVVKSP